MRSATSARQHVGPQADAPPMRAKWERCTDYAEDDFYFNPFGRFRFQHAGSARGSSALRIHPIDVALIIEVNGDDVDTPHLARDFLIDDHQ